MTSALSNPRLALLTSALLFAVPLGALAQPPQPGRILAPVRKQANKPLGTPKGSQQLAPPLRRMLSLQSKIRISGRRVVEFREGGQRLRHTEIVLRDGLRQRIEFPSDSPYAGQVIVENNLNRRQFLPQRDEIRVLPPKMDAMLDRFGRLGKAMGEGSVRLSVSSGGVIAGVRAQQLTFSDDKGNALQRMWVDPKSGLMLKRELYGPTGERVGYFEFTEVKFDPVFAPGDFEIRRKGARMVTVEDTLLRLAKKLGLRPARIPSSEPYRLENARIVNLPSGQVLAQVYFGGGARISLFQKSGVLELPRAGKARRVSAYGWQSGGVGYLLVGEASNSELMRLSRLVR